MVALPVAAAPALPVTGAAGLSPEARIAVLPMENLSSVAVSMWEIESALRERLELRGVNVLGEQAMEEFMALNRIRYTGGVSRSTAAAFGDRTATGAILVSSLDLVSRDEVPKYALTARLVSADDGVRILWMDSVQVAGHEHPGLLDLGMVYAPEVVLGDVLDAIADSLSSYLRLGSPSEESPGRPRKKFRPKTFYRSLDAFSDPRPVMRIAVLPFENDSTQPYAGQILALQFIRHLSALPEIEVIEPGVVRQALLEGRVIREGGVSLPQVDLLRVMLDADLIVSGTVRDYEEAIGEFGNPLVAFSAHGVDPQRRQIVWSSFSYSEGHDRVYFWNLGMVHTAHGLSSEMARAVLARVSQERREGLDASLRAAGSTRGGAE
jgi:TolB-like protein